MALSTHSLMRRLLSRFSSSKIEDKLQFKRDKYNAIHLTPSVDLHSALFDDYIRDLLSKNQSNGTTSVWVHLKGTQISLATTLINSHQFVFHRGGEKSLSLYRWLLKDRKDLVVPYSLFHVGCGGVIIHKDSILLIQEKKGDLKGRFGIPGGRADFGQSIQQCSERQLFEQIGIKTKFKQLLWLRELSSYVYNSNDIYAACLMHAEQQQINKIKVCDYEIASYIWVPLKDLKTFSQKNSFGTQLEFANYLSDLYLRGYDFSKPRTAYHSKIYTSPVDKKQRFFGQHFLADLQ